MKSHRPTLVMLATLGFAVALPLTVRAQSQYEPYTFSTLPDVTSYGAEDVAVYGTTNIYFINPSQALVRQIRLDGTITNIAGLVDAPGTNDGTGSAARFNFPRGLAADSAGNLYVADTLNFTIRKIAPGGVVTTLAGSPGNSGDNDSPNARFTYPYSVAVDDAGNVYVGDSWRVRKINPAGIVTTLAGVAGVQGGNDGVGPEARFSANLYGIAVDSSGNVYVADTGGQTIRKVTPTGEVTTLAGLYQQTGSADGLGSNARFFHPEGIGVDGNGNVFVGDTQNLIVRKITPAGMVTTIAGIPGVFGTSDGRGTNALFSGVYGLAVSSVGSIVVAEPTRIRVSWKNINSWASEENGKWEEVENWSVDSPSDADTVNYITNAVTKIVGIDVSTVEDSPETLTINNLIISAPGSDINTLALYSAGTANPLVVKDNLIVDSRGVVIVTNSAIKVGQGLVVGRTNGNGGLIIMGGGKVTSQVGYVGFVTDTFNNVHVSGAGATWTNQTALFVGVNSSENSLLIDFGGTVVDEGPAYVGYGGDNNSVAVTNTGSVWRNLDDVIIGFEGGAQNGLLVGNGGKVVNEGYTAVGYTSDQNGAVVTDAGSLWQNAGPLVIGDDSGNDNYLNVANGGVVQVGYASQNSLDIGTGGVRNGVFVTGSGSLLNCSGPISLIWGSPATYDDFNGLYIADGGTVTTPSLVVSNGNEVGLISGTLNTGETIVHNGLAFPVGIGQAPATLHLNDGEHLFANGLLVTSNALLTGCGVVHGPVVVAAGGTVQVGAGCSLTFTGNVTNNGAIQTNSGSSVIFLGTLVNNGTIGTNTSSGPPACATVISGNIVNFAEVGPPFFTPYTVTDGTNFAQFNWSLAGPGASGFIYATFNTHVAVATGITNIDQVFNAANFTFATNAFSGVGPVMDAVANGGIGQFVILKNKNTGHYAVVRMDDVQANDTLNATWWFQTSGGTNFSCLTPPSPIPPAVTNLVLQANSGGVSLSFATQLGRTYTIEMRTNLTVGAWTTVTNFVGDGAQRAFSLSVTNRPQGYYRVGVQ